jgi:hypothetical protein
MFLKLDLSLEAWIFKDLRFLVKNLREILKGRERSEKKMSQNELISILYRVVFRHGKWLFGHAGFDSQN